MACFSRAPWERFPGLTAAISLGTSYYVGLGLLSILVIVLLVYAYRVWEEIHEDVEPDSPADLLDSFEQAHAEGELDVEELDRVRRLLLNEENARGGQVVAPGSKPPSAGTIADAMAIRDAAPSAPATGEGRDEAS